MRRLLLALALAALGAGGLAIGSAGGEPRGPGRPPRRPSPPSCRRCPRSCARGSCSPRRAPSRRRSPLPRSPPIRASRTPVPGRPGRPAPAFGARGVLRDAAGGGVRRATALSNGVALPPFEAPEAVRQIIEAGNSIARTPYKWGGGHGRWQDTGYVLRLGLVRARRGRPARRPACLGSSDVLGRARPGPVGHHLREPRPRLPRGRGHPLRHLRAEAHRLALGERATHPRGLRRPPSARPLIRHRPGADRHPPEPCSELGVPTP